MKSRGLCACASYIGDGDEAGKWDGENCDRKLCVHVRRTLGMGMRQVSGMEKIVTENSYVWQMRLMSGSGALYLITKNNKKGNHEKK